MNQDIGVLQAVILRLCEEKGITVNKLATMSGITQSTIASILIGKSANPKMTTLIALADYFDVSLDYLVGRSDEPTTHRKEESHEQ